MTRRSAARWPTRSPRRSTPTSPAAPSSPSAEPRRPGRPPRLDARSKSVHFAVVEPPHWRLARRALDGCRGVALRVGVAVDLDRTLVRFRWRGGVEPRRDRGAQPGDLYGLALPRLAERRGFGEPPPPDGPPRLRLGRHADRRIF